MNSSFKEIVKDSFIKERKAQMLRTFIKSSEEMLDEIKNDLPTADFDDIVMKIYDISEKTANEVSEIITNAEFNIKDIIKNKLEELDVKSNGKEESSTC